MKFWRTNRRGCVLSLLLLLGLTTTYSANAQQELVFRNGRLYSGTDKADNAVYRFSNVTTGVDALVKINGRSSSLVKLESLDLSSTGWDKAFQPQVTYNNGSINGSGNWYMEFLISFVQTNTIIPVVVNNFDVTAIDVDGDGRNLSEHVTFYKQQSTILENLTLLTSTVVTDVISGVSTLGKRFNGPITNFGNIDTLSTRVMITSKYQNITSFVIRAGARTIGSSNATDRMNSFWFKGFSYTAPVEGPLPVVLTSWSASLSNNMVALKWSTGTELNASHYVIQKSTDGVDYHDAAVVFAAGTTNLVQNYSYNDKLATGSNGTLYYRLKMVDLDGKYKTSDVKTIHLNRSSTPKVIAYPNPAANDLHVIIPAQWQGKQVLYQLVNGSGVLVKTFTVSQAGQTENLNMTGMPVGNYILKVSQGNELFVQGIIKSKN